MAPAVDLEPDPTLSTTQVGELFDVHPSTVKRWCERGDLPFHRTEGGHRRIHLSDALRGKPDGALAAELAEFGRDAGSVWLAERDATSSHDFRKAYELAARWLEERAFHRIRDLLVYLGRIHPEILPHLLDAVTREVMRGVGRWWEKGRLGVGGEHLASETMTEALFQLRGELPVSRDAGIGRPVALVGCAEGERHVMGAHAIRLLLEQRGWQVRFLGADVPVDSWEDLQKEYAASLLCISFSSLRAWGEVVRTVRRLADAYDPARPHALAIGGGMALSGEEEPDIPAPTDEESGLPVAPPFEDLRIFSGAADFTEWLTNRGRETA